VAILDWKFEQKLRALNLGERKTCGVGECTVCGAPTFLRQEIDHDRQLECDRQKIPLLAKSMDVEHQKKIVELCRFALDQRWNFLLVQFPKATPTAFAINENVSASA